MSEKNSSSWQEKVLDPVAAHIGKRIRDRREVLGLTSDDVARRVGMSLQQAEEVLSGFGGGTELFFPRFAEKNYSAQRRNAARAPQGRIIRHTAEREQEKRETAELTSYYYSLPPRERHLFFYLMKETMYFVLKEREI